MNKPILIAQITDLHIKRPGELAYGKVDTGQALQNLMARLAAFTPRPDLVVVTGDLADSGTPVEYAHLKLLLEPLDLPLLVCPGNHDDRTNLRAAFPAQSFATPSACNTRHHLGPLTLLITDTSTPGKSHGTLDDETLEWLSESLKEAAALPVMIFMHHPPFATGIWHMDRQNLVAHEELARLVAAHGNVQLIAAGHVHRAVVSAFAGSVATIAPAPNHAVALDLDQSQEPAFYFEPPGFHLHVWYPTTSSLVTHLVHVGPFDGPHPFFGNTGKLL